MLVQLHKVVFQVALDMGAWDTAVLLWPLPDPLGSEEYAGNPDEMLAAQKWNKAMIELKPKARGRPQQDGEEEGDEDRAERQRRPRGKGKAMAADGGQ